MKLIVGLGNPGKEYDKTRHNTGYMTIDYFAEKNNATFKLDTKLEGFISTININGNKVILLKPTTYMNLSGTAVSEVVNYFKIDINDIIVICDDMAIDVGKIRLRPKGSSGGQKGLQNIIDNLKTEDFKRIRIGIGEPDEYGAIDYVLGKPTKDERPLIDEAINLAVEAIKEAFKTDFERAMSKFN